MSGTPEDRNAGPYATPADVDLEHTDTDAAWPDQQIARLLADAHDLAAQGRDLPARIADGRTTPGLVRRVLVDMVTAVLRNPAGLRSLSHTETAGPYSTAGYSTFTHDGRLRVTREQRRTLGDRTPGIRTVAPTITAAP